MGSIYSLRRLAALSALSLAVMAPARAADDVSLADLRAATRALGFLQNLPRKSEFVIGIVHAGNGALAQQTAERMRGLAGPNNAVFKTQIVPLNELAAHADRLDAIYLLPGGTAGGAAVVEVARRRHIPVLSNDRACLDANCCMLMVRDTGQVEIILDTGLTKSAGVNFSSVFAMMVKRK
jgi:ABC-type sugar transport system substrate-binding protein